VYLKLKDKLVFKEVESPDGQKFYKFLNQDDPETIVTEAKQEIISKKRMDVINEMIKSVQLAKDGFVACLNGPVGIGKSNIFGALKMTFAEDNSNIWLLGQCSLQAKNSPLFFFRDVLQNLFDIPAFNIDIETTKQRVYAFLSEKLNLVDESFVNNLFAILFYDETRLQNNIYNNKQETYHVIATLFRTLLSKGAVVLQIEDIENIDNFSLEIIRELFSEGILKCNLKLFITSNINNDIVQFFASPNLTYENSFFVQYPVMVKAEIDDFIMKAIGVREELGSKILNHIYDYSNGLPIFIEEFLYLLLQLGLIKFTNNVQQPIEVSAEIENIDFPKTVQEIVQLRLTNISNANPNAFKTLYYASITGIKFLPAVIQNILQLDEETFTGIIKFLSMNNFIIPFDSYNYVFKNRMLWDIIRNLQLSPDNKVSGVTNTIKVLLQLTMPDMATVIHNLLNVSVPKYEIINHIEQATKEAYCIGDDFAYIYYKSLLLEAVELSTIENKDAIVLSIKDELINLTYISFPDVSIKYADDMLTYYEPIDTAKTISILGMMSVSFECTGNHLASIECADKAMEKIDPKTNQFAAMSLYYSKLYSILQLGRYEEVINVANNNIIPVLDLYKSGKLQENTSLSPDNIQYIELETLYIRAFASILQGSPAQKELIPQLFDIASSNQNNEYILKSKILTAISKLIQGEIVEVENALTEIKASISDSKDYTLNTLMWLFVNTCTKYFRGNYAEITNELMMLANFSINVKHFALEPIIKAFIVKISLKEGNLELAQNLAYEQYYKCANNQWAFGALLNWYMYCETSLYMEKYDDALKVAQNALEVAEKANINNMFFASLFKMKTAEIYAIRGDLDMAKINA